jgi:plasmid stabilization system protein ParE
MTYRIIVMPRAESDLSRTYQYIHSQAPRAASDWLKRARQAVKTLAHHPERCPLAPESASFDEPIRELFFGSGNRGTYRLLFIVAGIAVYVLHVRHGSMLPLSPDE